MTAPNIKKILQNKAKAAGVTYSKVAEIYKRGLAAFYRNLTLAAQCNIGFVKQDELLESRLTDFYTTT